MQSMELRGAAGEVVCASAAFRIMDAFSEAVEISATDLIGSSAAIGASNVELFRIHAVQTGRWPGWHIRSTPRHDRPAERHDVLVPVDAPYGGIRDVRAGDLVPIWIDVSIPLDAKPGPYRGEIRVTVGDQTAARFEIQLAVWPFRLPGEDDIPIIAPLDHRTLFTQLVGRRDNSADAWLDDWRGAPNHDQYQDVLRSTLALLVRHRVNPVLPHWSPTVGTDANGDMTIDWRLYDETLYSLIDAAHMRDATLPVWLLPITNVLPDRLNETGAFSAGFQSLVREYLTLATSHFTTLMPGASVVLDLSAIKPEDPDSRMAESGLLELARRADRRIRTMSRWFPQDMSHYGWTGFDPPEIPVNADIWATRGQYFDPAVMVAERALGRNTWLSLDRPPFSGTVDYRAPSAHARVVTWQAGRLGAEALLVDTVNAWPDSAAPISPQQTLDNSPTALLFSGRAFGVNAALPSVRLKQLRQSAQDAAYLRLMRDKGLGHVADALAESLSAYAGTHAYKTHYCDGRPTGWVEDDRSFEFARLIMGEALAGIERIAAPDPVSGRFARDVNWRRFMQAARRVQMTVDGVRVRRSSSGGQFTWETQLSLSLYNGRRVPVEGEFEIAAPDSWKDASEDHALSPISPDEWRREFLSLVGDAPTISPTGATAIPISLLLNDGLSLRRAARLSLVAATPHHRPIVLDGDLSDWPPGWGNVAGDFISVSPPSRNQENGEQEGAARETLVFVLRDAAHLYVAVNARIDPDTLAPQSRRNTVIYDDLIPVGEDLIELLFDPLNAGTRTPSDVFRLLIKPTGAYWAEKGISTDPPCGSRRAWSADAVVAVKTAEDRWTTEVQIPLGSFEAFSTQNAVWGFNVTRFDATEQELSTWSGASGNPYDPLSLGNLFLP
jgi:hypothetical protein